MGLCRSITSAIFWPLAIYAALLTHAVVWHYYTAPSTLSPPEFPKSISAADRNVIVKARQPLLQGVKDAIGGKGSLDFLNK